MKKLFWFFVIGVTVFLSGCATTSRGVDSGHHVFFKTEIIKKPAIGIISEVSVGESMISTYSKQIVPTLILKSDIIYDGKYNGFINRFRIRKGFLKLTKENFEGRFFSAKDGISIEVPAIESTYSLDGGIFLYKDKPNSTAIFLINKTTGKFRIQPVKNIDFEVIEKEEWSDTSFKKELVYTGKSANTLSILYREFIKDMARPAFHQEIKYDLKDTKIVGYKNARFEIIDADNLSIRYKTIKQLE